MDERLEEIERWAGQPLPAPYRQFLAAHEDDLFVGEVVVLYGLAGFIERNEAYEVQRYAPGCVTVGNDSGGREFLLALNNGRLGLVDAGSMRPEDAWPLAEEFGSWLETGCRLPDSPESAHPDRIDIYLLRPPVDGLSGLVRILKLLDQHVPVVEYRRLLAQTPCRLARDAEYLRYSWRCAEYNQKDDCLGTFQVDRPDQPISIAPHQPPRGAPPGLDLS